MTFDWNWWLELFAATLGVLSVWYARKENILVFPFGIVNVLIYIYICFAARLYANAGINMVYFISNAFGWYMWGKNDDGESRVEIAHNTMVQNIISWLSIVGIYALALFVLRYANRTDMAYLHDSVFSFGIINLTLPHIDAFNTAFFMVATILMVFKKVENWVFWTVGNVVSIPIYISQGLYFTGIQYAIFLVLALMGWIEWRKKIKSTAMEH